VAHRRDISPEQATIEKMMVKLGKDSYDSSTRKAKVKHTETNTRPGRVLLREAVEKFSTDLTRWIRVAQSSAGYSHAAVGLLMLVQPDRLALLTSKVIIDGISSQRDYRQVVHSVGQAIEAEVLMEDLRSNKLWFRRLRQRAAEAGANRVLIAIKRADKKFDLISRKFPPMFKAQVGTILVERFVESTGLVVISGDPVRHGNKFKTRLRLSPTAETKEWIESSHSAHREVVPFLMPCLDVPDPWESLTKGGYKSEAALQAPLVKPHRFRVLGEVVAGSDAEEAMTAATAIQNTGYRINKVILEVVRHAWDNSIELSGVPARDDILYPRRLTPAQKLDPELVKSRSNILLRTKYANERMSSQRMMFCRTLSVAGILEDKEAFYYPSKMDFRGRIYPRPYFLSPQGNDLARGLLEFSESTLIETGTRAEWWLAIHVANCFGIDKVTYAERVAWAEENRDEIIATFDDPWSMRLWEEADEPFKFLAAAVELGELWSNGSVESRIPVHVDGSNNGLQIYSLLLRDTQSGLATNCVPSAFPQDIYQQVADAAEEYLKKDLRSSAALVLEIVDGPLPRASVKRPVMTLPYGVTRHSSMAYLREWMKEELESQGRPYFLQDAGSNYFEAAATFCDALEFALGEIVISAVGGMEWLQQVAAVMSEHNLACRWTTPTGLLVVQTPMMQNARVIKTAMGLRLRKAVHREDTPEINPTKAKFGIAPNFVHSLDAACMARIVVRCKEDGIYLINCIHDSFGTTADRMDDLAKIIREVYVEIFQDDLLETLRIELQSQLPDGVDLPPVPPLGSLDLRALLESEYFFA
jgi:DNA-directed RNA polymerase